MKVKICKTLIDPDDIPVSSSKHNRFYLVTPPTYFNDGVCECPGYLYRGYCRHLEEISESRCTWISSNWQDPLDKCPGCGADAIVFDFEPYYDRD